MNYKTLYQFLLIILVMVLSTWIYIEYFYSKNLPNLSQTKNSAQIDREDISDGNTVKEILYESFDNDGNKYIIRSDFGTFSDEIKEEILMTNVKAIIYLKDGTFMNLTSNKARYNTVSSDTYFYNNVKLNYLNHKIVSDNIDVLFQESKLAAYSNLVYRNLDIKLLADKVEVDLLKQSTKIFMLDQSKVRIMNN